MKKEMLGIFGLFLLVSIGFASAGWFDWITGHSVDENSCEISNIDFQQVSGKSYNEFFISVQGNFNSEDSLFLSGADSWSGLEFRLNSSEDSIKVYKAIQTVNFGGTDFILARSSNLSLVSSDGKIVCTQKDSSAHNSQCFHSDILNSWINKLDHNINFCSESDGLIATLSDECIDDSGSSASGDNLEIYCSDNNIKLCLSGEECPWREDISSENENSCVGDYDGDFVRVINYQSAKDEEEWWDHDETVDTTIYCNKNYDGTTTWSTSSFSSKNPISNSEQERICYDTPLVKSWIERFSEGGNSCSESNGLIATIPDKCIGDSGLSIQGDNLEIYCSNSKLRICLSGEECPWRTSITSNDKDTCVGDYEDKFVELYDYYGMSEEDIEEDETSDLVLYCNKNADETRSWSISDSSKVKEEIDNLFSDGSSKLAFAPANRVVNLKQGSVNEGFAFSIRNNESSKKQFSYNVYLDPSYDLTANCGSLTLREVESWIVNPSGIVNLLGNGSNSDNPELILFNIPSSASTCTIPYIVSVKKDGDTYVEANVYVQISSSDLDCSLIEFDRSIFGKSQCVSNCECLENLDAPGIFVEFYRVEKDKYCMVRYSGIYQKECDSNCECVTAGYEQVSWDEMETYDLTGSDSNEDEEEQTPSTCQLGYRENGSYCNKNLEMVSQKVAESACDNNFECESNLCINGECVSGSIWTKFMSWLKNIFG